MTYWKNILYTITIAANCLLCFLLFFYDRLIVPPWLQVVGRIHPLFLHFPIVLLVLFIGWIWIVPRKTFSSPKLFQDLGKWLLLSAAFTAVITALMGIFLSKEPGYDQDSLQWHKWSAVTICLLTCLWYVFYDALNKIKILAITIGISEVLILTFAGHEGASITHGENFLLAPVTPEKIQKKVPLDEAVVFADMVEPILEAKCMSCHNSKKAKGELVMESQQLLLKGGKDGALWDTVKPGMSLLLQRIHLPVEEKKHMPPNNRQQLTAEEMTILYSWIKDGASFKLKVTDLPEMDTLRSMAEKIFNASGSEENYEFAAANENIIQKLNTNYRAVYSLAKGSPAIAVDFYGASFFKTAYLKDLLEIKTQVVSLNLDKMPVTDDDMQTIGQFTNLRNLNLSFSKITGTGLSALSKFNHLKNLSLSNTSVKADDIRKLTFLKELRHVYVWNTGIAIAEAKSLQHNYPSLDIETGMRTDTMFIKLNPPILQNEEQIIDTPVRLKLKHYVPGITIRYTLDGSDPDSIHSPLYSDHAVVEKQSALKAKAFKPGWHGSDILKYQFYKATFKPDTIIMLKPADSLYKGKGGKTLNNLEKGDLNFGSGKWLGFRKNPMECMLIFSKPVRAQNVTISSIVDVGSLVFPPVSIDVWGGNNIKELRLLNHTIPAQVTTLQPAYLTPYECKFNPVNIKFIKVVVKTLEKLPKQFIPPKDDKEKPKDKKDAAKKKKEPPKINKGWFFTDEIFVN